MASNPSVIPVTNPTAPAGTQGTTTQTAPSSRYNTVARTQAEIDKIEPVVRQELRSTLDQKSLTNLRQYAVSPLKQLFNLPNVQDDSELLAKSYTISSKLAALKIHLQKYDMIDCFMILTPTDVTLSGEIVGPGLQLTGTDPTMVNLIANYATVEEQQVINHVHFLRLYGQKYDLQNLDWSTELLTSSCDSDLSDKVSEKLTKYPISKTGGPLYLWHILNLIISTSEAASKALLDRLENIKIHTIDGENILQVISLLRGALDRLKVVNKTPVDVVDKVLDIFQTSSVKDFNTVFKTLKLNVRLKISTGYTLEYIFQTAETFYREMQETHKWIGLGNDSSVFVTCWNCGEDGHVFRNCNKTRNKFLPSNIQTSNQNQNFNQPSQSNRISRKSPFWTQQPADGCTTKVINGQTYYWCHHCARWNKTHTTKQHTGPKRMSVNNKLQNSKSNSINLNSNSTTSDPPSNSAPAPSSDHENKVNALAAVMSDLASTASSSLTGSDVQPSTNFTSSSQLRNRWA